eukprot:TRINITY_DN12847_c0_g1_i1.p1 TRINITY_DN12847_c0_g1~~TRINITY_DN12847_c0_g1_i1.p1  ORF type:complete len:459 (+),score=45.14 TRINITY_DN12847_c0_g1_i1:8-1384(+)
MPFFTPTTDTLDQSQRRSYQNNWVASAGLIAAAMAGAGVLAIPMAINQSGWVGVILLIICGILSNITANLLGEVMFHIEGLRDYADIGEKAFGSVGRLLATVSQYTTLAGISIIYLILFGSVMNSLPVLSCAPSTFYTGLGGVLVLCLVVVLPSMKEVAWAGPFAVFSTLSAAIMVVVISVLFKTSDDYVHYRASLDLSTQFVTSWETIWTAFSVFVFAFGGHSLIPNIYADNRNSHEWWKSTNLAYNVILFIFYLPVGITAYDVYGAFLSTEPQVLKILVASEFGNKFVIPVTVASALIIVHLVAVLPIVTNPVMSRVERFFLDSCTQKDSKVESEDDDMDQLESLPPVTFNVLQRFLIRAPVMTIITVIAMFFPYFLSFMSLITAFSIMCNVYIFPALLSWKLFPPQTIGKRIFLVCLVIWGLVGIASGFYVGILGLISEIRSNPSPWENIFEFTC